MTPMFEAPKYAYNGPHPGDPYPFGSGCTLREVRWVGGDRYRLSYTGNGSGSSTFHAGPKEAYTLQPKRIIPAWAFFAGAAALAAYEVYRQLHG